MLDTGCWILDKMHSLRITNFIMETHYPVSSIQHQLLTLAWSIKETMFKWYGAGGIDFKQHLHIKSIVQDDNQFTAQCIFQKNEPVHLKVHGLFFNDNYLTWVVS